MSSVWNQPDEAPHRAARDDLHGHKDAFGRAFYQFGTNLAGPRVVIKGRELRETMPHTTNPAAARVAACEQRVARALLKSRAALLDGRADLAAHYETLARVYQEAYWKARDRLDRQSSIPA